MDCFNKTGNIFFEVKFGYVSVDILIIDAALFDPGFYIVVK